MNNISKKKLVFIALLTVFAIIVLEWSLQRTEGVHIGLSIGTSQGAAENNTKMEIIKVNGTFWNEGDITAKNLTATLIFLDTVHNKILSKTVKEGIDLPPNKGQIVEFYSEYLIKRTIPKTDANIEIRFDWMENGQIKTTETLISGNEPDSPGNNNS